MQETEITVEVLENEGAIKLKLNELGFNVVRHVVMTDSYFSKFSTEELLKMSYGKIMSNSFLVRKLAGDTNCTLLHYKDKKLDNVGNVIAEEKLAEPVTDFENCVKIFKQANINNWCNIVQDMYIYKGNDMEFALQIVDGLGIFIEYEEDASVAGLKPEEKVVKMVKKLNSFGLNLGKDHSVKKVYLKFLKEQDRHEVKIM